MYINSDKQGTVATFGKVSVEVFRSSYRLRFRLGGERKVLTVGRISEASFKVACAKAQQIDLDILTGHFDATLVKYDPERAQALSITAAKQVSRHNLLTLWEWYKGASRDRAAKTTQKDPWTTTDSLLAKVSPTALELDNVDQFIRELLRQYAVSTIERTLANLHAATNAAYKKKLIPENPLENWRDKLPKVQKQQNKRPEAWLPEEVQTILKAFECNTYNPSSSTFQHSYYLGYVTFLALTGCRPEEAIALTWDDIKSKNGKVQIVLSKAYSKGILNPHTHHPL